MKTKVKVYATSNCQACHAVSRYFDSHDVEYEKVFVDQDLDELNNMQRDGGGMSVPFVVAGETKFAGYNPKQLEKIVMEG